MHKKEENNIAVVESKGLPKAIKIVGSFTLALVQVIPLMEGWISYVLGSVIASLITPISYFSLLWYPLDLLCKFIWVGCDWLKSKIENRDCNWSHSLKKWESLFPSF